MKQETRFKRINELEKYIEAHTQKEISKEGAGLVNDIVGLGCKDADVDLARHIHNSGRGECENVQQITSLTRYGMD